MGKARWWLIMHGTSQFFDFSHSFICFSMFCLCTCAKPIELLISVPVQCCTVFPFTQFRIQVIWHFSTSARPSRSLWNHLQFSKPAQCVLYLFLFELSCWTFESYDDDDDNDDDDDDDDDDSDDVVCFACSCSICCPWQSKTTTQIAKFMIHTTRGNGRFPLRFSSIFYSEVESLKGSVLLGVLVASLGKSIGFLWRLYWHSWTLWSLVNLLWVNVVNYLVRMTSQKKHPCQSLPFRHISPMATTEGSLARCSTLARDNLQLCHELLVRRVSC